MAEHQVLLDAIFVGRVDRGGAAEVAAALGILGLTQMPPAGTRAHDFPTGRYLEPLGHRFLGLDAFWTSHNSFSLLSKRARNIGSPFPGIKPYFCPIAPRHGYARATPPPSPARRIHRNHRWTQMNTDGNRSEPRFSTPGSFSQDRDQQSADLKPGLGQPFLLPSPARVVSGPSSFGFDVALSGLAGGRRNA